MPAEGRPAEGRPADANGSLKTAERGVLALDTADAMASAGNEADTGVVREASLGLAAGIVGTVMVTMTGHNRLVQAERSKSSE